MMQRKSVLLLPREAEKVQQFGMRLKQARLRRHIPEAMAAARVGVSRTTLRRVENGDSDISVATYFRYLGVVHLDGDFDLLARDDHVRMVLQEAELRENRARVSK